MLTGAVLAFGANYFIRSFSQGSDAALFSRPLIKPLPQSPKKIQAESLEPGQTQPAAQKAAFEKSLKPKPKEERAGAEEYAMQEPLIGPDAARYESGPAPQEISRKIKESLKKSLPSPTPVEDISEAVSDSEKQSAQLPIFTPISSDTGPVAPVSSAAQPAGQLPISEDVQTPPSVSADITAFVPQESPTGPASGSTTAGKPLPPFTPTPSATGPLETQ